MVKLRLNPSLQLIRRDEDICLISEVDCYSFSADYFPLLSQLQAPTGIDEIARDQAERLQQLGELRLLVNANLNELAPDVASYWLAKGYHPAFTAAQLDLSLQFIGPHGARYGALFAARYPECTVVDDGGQLLVYVTDDLLECRIPHDLRAPLVLIKVGGLKQSIGPVLSPGFTWQDLADCIDRPFDANLSIPVPARVQETADNILLSELYHLRVQAGNHAAVNHVVEWNMTNLTKTSWKVKPV